MLRRAFLVEASYAFGATSAILRRFEVQPVQADPLDVSALASAVSSVCIRTGHEESGIRDLAVLVQVFEAYHAAVRQGGVLESTEVERGCDAARRYRSWLRSWFRSV